MKLCDMTIQVTFSAVLSHVLFMTLYKQGRTIESVGEIIRVKHSQKYLINVLMAMLYIQVLSINLWTKTYDLIVQVKPL